MQRKIKNRKYSDIRPRPLKQGNRVIDLKSILDPLIMYYSKLMVKHYSGRIIFSYNCITIGYSYKNRSDKRFCSFKRFNLKSCWESNDIITGITTSPSISYSYQNTKRNSSKRIEGISYFESSYLVLVYLSSLSARCLLKIWFAYNTPMLTNHVVTFKFQENEPYASIVNYLGVCQDHKLTALRH